MAHFNSPHDFETPCIKILATNMQKHRDVWILMKVKLYEFKQQIYSYFALSS